MEVEDISEFSDIELRRDLTIKDAVKRRFSKLLDHELLGKSHFS